MRSERLFLQRCEQVAILIQSHREIELLDLASHLYQLLSDQHPLMDAVNKNRVPVRFHVGQFRTQPDRFTTLLSLEDGLDPDTRPPGSPAVHVRKDQFLAHAVTYLRGAPVSVLDIIKFARNIAGGAHYSPKPKPQFEQIALFSENFDLGGLPLGIRQLKAIGRVTARAMAPLIEDVNSRV